MKRVIEKNKIHVEYKAYLANTRFFSSKRIIVSNCKKKAYISVFIQASNEAIIYWEIN